MKRLSIGLMLCGLSAFPLGPTSVSAIPVSYVVPLQVFVSGESGMISGTFTLDTETRPPLSAFRFITFHAANLASTTYDESDQVGLTLIPPPQFGPLSSIELFIRDLDTLQRLFLYIDVDPTGAQIRASLNEQSQRVIIGPSFGASIPELIIQREGTEVPEPSTFGLLGLPLLGLLAARVYGRHHQ